MSRRSQWPTYASDEEMFHPAQREAGKRFLKKASPAEQVEHALMADTTEVVVIEVDRQDLMPSKGYNARFRVVSQSSGSFYTVTQHLDGWWACSCKSWTTRRHCKHLKSLGLPGFLQPFLHVKLKINDG